jgi:hypothetical protein
MRRRRNHPGKKYKQMIQQMPKRRNHPGEKNKQKIQPEAKEKKLSRE